MAAKRKFKSVATQHARFIAIDASSATKVAAKFNALGHEAWVVGGYPGTKITTNVPLADAMSILRRFRLTHLVMMPQ